MLLQGAEAPLEAAVVVCRIIVLYVLLVLLVDGVVSQMSIDAAFCGAIPCALVFLACKPHQAFSVHIDSQWVVACDNDVDPEVKLVPKKEEWVVDVPRNDAGLVPGSMSGVVDNENSLPLGGGCRLDNPQVLLADPLNVARGPTTPADLLLYGIKLLFKFVELIREHKRLGYEVKVCLGVPFLHPDDVLGKPVFSSQL